jgi:nucleoside-diphosphate-sugar epimerase
MKHLITGGSGFIGNLVARELLGRGDQVHCLDIWEDPSRPRAIEFTKASVLDRDAVRAAMKDVDVVHHNAALVAQCDAGDNFWKVNVDGTRVVIEEAIKAKVGAVIHTSSTSVFGLPPKDGGPITASTPTEPVEPYGRSKLAGEKLSEALCVEAGMPLITIRPRATLGAGRLGIYQILFEWISENRNVYTIGDGSNKMQFIHAHDLMSLYMLALETGKTGTYNVGAHEFGTLREDLESLIEYAGSTSKVIGLPKGFTKLALQILWQLKLSPLSPYHYLTYHTSCYFDIQPCLELGWRPKYSNIAMLKESYDWFLDNKSTSAGFTGSPHRSPLQQKILTLLKRFS